VVWELNVFVVVVSVACVDQVLLSKSKGASCAADYVIDPNDHSAKSIAARIEYWRPRLKRVRGARQLGCLVGTLRAAFVLFIDDLVARIGPAAWEVRFSLRPFVLRRRNGKSP